MLAAVLLGVLGLVAAAEVDTVPASVYLAASQPDDDYADPCDVGGSCGTCNPVDWDALCDRLEADR